MVDWKLRPRATELPVSMMSVAAPVSRASLVADWNGDGFDDILEIQPSVLDAEDDPAISASATLYLNDRTIARGRVVQIHDAWGGSIDVTYAASTQSGDNLEMPFVLRVIETVDDELGPTNYAFSGGTYYDGQFRGFSDVSVGYESGRVRHLAFSQSHVFGYALVYESQHRSNGALEYFDYYSYCEIDSRACHFDMVAPYFNPVRRHCSFWVDPGTISGGVGLWDLTEEGLVEQCMEFEGMNEESTPWGRLEYEVLHGWERFPDEGTVASDIMDRVWTDELLTVALPVLDAELQGSVVDPYADPSVDDPQAEPYADDPNGPPPPSNDGATQPIIHRPEIETFSFVAVESDVGDETWMPEAAIPWFEPQGTYPPLANSSLRPDGLSGPTPPSRPSDGLVARLPSTRMYVEEFAYNHEQRLQTHYDHADTGIAEDDLEVVYGHRPYDTARHGQEVDLVEILDYRGRLVSRTLYSNFVPGWFNFAQTIEEDGGTGVRITNRTFDRGNVQLLDDGLGTTRWARNACGVSRRIERSVDSTGTVVEEVEFDAACRELSRTSHGGTVRVERDAFGRVVLEWSRDGSGAAEYLTQAWLRDDRFGQTTSPRSVLVRADGSTLTSWLDGWGRRYRTRTCALGGSSGVPAGIAGSYLTDLSGAVSCDATVSPEVYTFQGWATDGTLRVTSESYFPSALSIPAQWVYRDEAGRPERVLAPAPVEASAPRFVTTSHTYGPGRSTTVDPMGASCAVTFDTMLSEYSCAGVTYTIEELDPFGRVTAVIDAQGVAARTEYDLLGRPIERWIEDGSGSIATVEDCDGVSGTLQWSYAYDDRDRLVEEVQPNGNVQWTEYDGLNRPTSVWLDDGTGPQALTRWEYTDGSSSVGGYACERTVEEIDLNENSTVVCLDGFDRTLLRVLPDGSTEERSYDPAGRNATLTTVDGVTTHIGYDAHGNVVDQTVVGTSHGSFTTTHMYDAAGRRVGSVDADGVETGRTYYWNGQFAGDYLGGRGTPPSASFEFTMTEVVYRDDGLVSEVLEEGVTSAYGYDALGRVVWTCIGGSTPGDCGIESELTYTSTGLVDTESLVDPDTGALYTTTYAYSDTGWLESTTNPDGATSHIEYTLMGDVCRFTDEEGIETEWDFDRWQRVVEERIPGQQPRYFEYQLARAPTTSSTPANVFVERVTEPDGEVWTTEFDFIGRPVFVDRPDNTTIERVYQGGQVAGVVHRDATGRPLAELEAVYDEFGRHAQSVGPFHPATGDGLGFVTTYAYSDAGRLNQVAAPESTVTNFTYDLTSGLLESEEIVGVSMITYERNDAPVPLVTDVLVGESTGDWRRIQRSYERNLWTAQELITSSLMPQVTRTFSSFDAYGTPRRAEATDASGVSVVYASETTPSSPERKFPMS